MSDNVYPVDYRGVKEFRVIQQDYHRNGIGGEGFIASVIESIPYDEDEPVQNLVAISFPEYDDEGENMGFGGRTAVLDLDILNEKRTIEFGVNSWRGSDMYGAGLWEHWKKMRGY
jgi:hypothetical protein